MINRPLTSHSQAESCELAPLTSLFTDEELVNAQVQNDHSQAINNHSQRKSAHSALREGYTPRRGVIPAGEGTRESEIPTRADLVTTEFARLAKAAGLGGNPESAGWLFRAFDEDFAKGAVLAQAYRNVDGTEETKC